MKILLFLLSFVSGYFLSNLFSFAFVYNVVQEVKVLIVYKRLSMQQDMANMEALVE